MTQESLAHDETSATVVEPDTDIPPVSDPSEAVLALLESIADAVQRREVPAPSAFFPAQFPTTVAVRLTWFVVSPSAAGVVTIKIGSAVEYTFSFAAFQPVALPMSILVKEGTDVVVATTAGTVAWYFLGYPE